MAGRVVSERIKTDANLSKQFACKCRLETRSDKQRRPITCQATWRPAKSTPSRNPFFRVARRARRTRFNMRYTRNMDEHTEHETKKAAKCHGRKCRNRISITTHVSVVLGCSACGVTSSAFCHHQINVNMSDIVAATREKTKISRPKSS